MDTAASGDAFTSLVSANWLAQNLNSPDLVILDASRHLPAAKRDPAAEFASGHIPGARFLDLANLTDKTSDVPAALPNAAQLADRMAELGINSGSRIVIYDDSAVRTSSRAWFVFKAHGISNVAVLDGGLNAWREEGRALESGPATIAACAPSALPAADGVACKADLLANLDTDVHQILDARGADRVFGSGIDPVHGGQNGRIPGALNLPFGQVFGEDGRFKSSEELRTVFEQSGTDLNAPIITTCGSGVTACVLLFALHLMGKDDGQLYDGSWQEWEADPSTPKQQGKS